jgi:branched-chain amino acid transport system permease protein
MTRSFTVRNVFVGVLVALLLALPIYTGLSGNSFLLTLFTRILILAMAATSLNLIMGYGGMVSFGHAAYLGVGGYVVGILAYEGVSSGFLQWPLAIVISALFALAIGVLSLRTRGVYFIMITLAFAQMIYYVAVGLKHYGGEDGLTIARRSTVGFGIDLSHDLTFYYVVLGLLVAVLAMMNRILDARFGRVLIGIRENESRMEAIGYPVYRYKLTAFTISGAVAGLAGALFANHNLFVSPAALHWTQSATLIVMVIVGGIGYRYGGVLGAVTLLALEELLAGITDYWHLPLGLLLLAVVFLAPRGLAGTWARAR